VTPLARLAKPAPPISTVETASLACCTATRPSTEKAQPTGCVPYRAPLRVTAVPFLPWPAAPISAMRSIAWSPARKGNPTDLAAKCHGRADQACAGFSKGSSVTVFLCDPLCRSDADCGSGLFCDPVGGLCSATKPTGDPAGTPCDPNAATTNCLGVCRTTSTFGATPATGVYVQYCSGLTECAYSSSKPGGYCGGAFGEHFGALDLGYCQPSCN
jgi:hypothetical protein